MFDNNRVCASENSKPSNLPKPKTVYTLNDIQSDTDDNGSSINISLDKKTNWTKSPELQDHGSFIQIILPDTIVPEPGKFYDLKGPYFTKMGIFQLHEYDAGVRIFVNQNASLILKATSLDILNEHIILTLEHKKLVEAITQAPTGQEMIAKLKRNENLPAPAGLLKDDKTSQKNPGSASLGFKNSSGLRERLIATTGFIGIMLLGFLGLILVRPIIKRKRIFGLDQKHIPIRTISTHLLAPKQKLALVEVAGNQILLGLSPGNISYLSTINSTMPQTLMYKPAAFENLSSPITNQHLLNAASLKNKFTEKRTLRRNLGGTAKHISSTPSSNAKNCEEKPKSTRPNFQAYVADEGISQKNTSSDKKNEDKASHDAINDVTKLIRQKLKNLPSF